MDCQQKLKELTDRYNLIKKNFGKDQKTEELANLQAQSQKDDFWQDPQKAQSIMKKISTLNEEINTIDQIDKELHDLSQMVDLSGSDPEMTKDLDKLLGELEKKMADLEEKMFLSGPYDQNNAILSIHAGQGGVEAMDWVAMLSRMYQKYFSSKKWDFEIINEIVGEEAGFKTVTIMANKDYAYGLLKNEAGVHRLVRQAPFNAPHIPPAVFALVEVMPEIEEEQELQINPDDIDFEA